MGKLDDLKRPAWATPSRVMGAFVAPRCTGATPGAVHGAAPAHLDGVTRAKNAASIPVEKIDRDPDQPREEFDAEALGRLAESLKARGQLQPIRVRWDEGRGVYVIVCGERRWRAARMAGLADGQRAWSMDGPIEPRRAAGHPARRERPPRGPEADRAGQGVSAADGARTAGRPARLARELAIDHSRGGPGPGAADAARGGPGAGGAGGAGTRDRLRDQQGRGPARSRRRWPSGW